jgi:hypothetical protein
MNIVALRRPPPAACQPPVPRAAANWHLALVGNKGGGLVADAQAGKHQFLVGKDCLGHNLVAIGRLLRRTAPGISVRAAAERLDASICDDCVHTGCTCGQPERVSHGVELPQVSTVGGVLKREGGSCVFRIDVPIARGLAPAIQLGRTRG